MAAVKMDDKKQNTMRVLSKILYLVGKISKILVRVGAGCLIFGMLVMPFAINAIDVKDGKIYLKDEYAKIITESSKTNVNFVNDKMVISVNDKEADNFIKMYNSYSKTTIIIVLEISLALLVGLLIILSLALDRLDKLFKNIYDGDTFTLDNVRHLRMMANFMVVCLLINMVLSVIGDILMNSKTYSIAGTNIIEIIFIYALSYVFEYGCELQKSNKTKKLSK